MPSPFPGMDPYLEGYLWPDVHHRLATEIARQLGAQIRPRYVARLEITVVEDIYPEVEIGVMYPDVEVLLAQRPSTLHEPSLTFSTKTPDLIAPFTLPLMGPVPHRIATVEVRDAANNQLVTSIEILSPVNKREPGLTAYREKQRRLREAGIHVLEIDWLRRGIRPLQHPRLPESAYLITLIRAQAAQAELWPLHLSDTLPDVPVPLHPPDPDVRLELGPILQTIYDEAGYDLSIDYHQPPPPPELSAEEAAWLQSLLRNYEL
ncbi:MAG: DUF4058 family protein [Anaerolineae bacterium]|nr:DUF4058 family protein [Anaerolineae bacterium]